MDIGARLGRFERQKQYLETFEIDLTIFASEIQDADITDLAIQLSMNEVSQRAAIGTASRIVQTNLVDLLT